MLVDGAAMPGNEGRGFEVEVVEGGAVVEGVADWKSSKPSSSSAVVLVVTLD